MVPALQWSRTTEVCFISSVSVFNLCINIYFITRTDRMAYLSLRKKLKSFLQNLANGDHSENAIMTQRFFSPCLRRTRKSKIIFAKFREWWPSRICHYDTAIFFVLLNAKEKVEINFCKISQMLTIAKIPSWHRAFFRRPWGVNSFLQNFADGAHREFTISQKFANFVVPCWLCEVASILSNRLMIISLYFSSPVRLKICF